MERKVAILRGINVGGKRKILMTDLKALSKKLGLQAVETYIQSGNLIFSSHQPSSELESQLEQALAGAYGFEVPVIVRTSAQLQAIVEKNPFYQPDTDLNTLHLTFLKQKPRSELRAALLPEAGAPDLFELGDTELYIQCRGKYHQSKLSNQFFEKKLQLGATTRNWKTVLKLQALSNE